MSEIKKYIIKYKFGNLYAKGWCYLTKITNYTTFSKNHLNDKLIMKMILKEAKKNMTKIKEIYKELPYYNVREIQIIDSKTNKIIDEIININQKEYTKFTRFEIMDI